MKIFFKKFLQLIFPNHCFSCVTIISGDGLFCKNCWQKLQFISEPKCEICSYPFEVEIKTMKPICGSCLKKKPSFDKLITIFRYNQIIQKAVTDFKYRDQTFLAEKFAKLLSAKIKKELVEFDLLVAVPLHVNRLKQRKFNQVVLIGRILVNEKNKFFPDLLWRIVDKKPQIKLNKEERENSLKRAFLVNKSYRSLVKNKTILLLDDVCTTGATLDNCAKELKRRGAKKVIALTIAKTVLD
jgi:ComF family protein